jgi:hypothetical protein
LKILKLEIYLFNFICTKEHDTELFINKIFEKWTETHGTAQTSNGGVKKKQEEVDIAKLLETQAKLVNKSAKQHREISEEQRKIKEQILANYSQCSDKEDDDDEEIAAGEESENDPNLEKNTNKADVAKLAREKREQARLESAAKKQKDKEDRAKQKATREEKKANRKAATVKGERKR